MNTKLLLTACVAVFCAVLAQACAGGANKAVKLGESSIDEVVAAMTLEEKARLLVGAGMAGAGGDASDGKAPAVGETLSLVPGAAGTTAPIPRLGIPAIVLADGPAGLRIAPRREGDGATYFGTAFPVATLLASTWNCALDEEVGKAIGNEVLEYGVDVLLAPALNIHRHPLCGRNFEYYSEDPLLSGKTAAAVVRGVQGNGVGTSVKHFAANNQETNRMGNDARVSPRALREIYLKGFEIAVKEGEPWTVMSSYNRVNGVYASESRELLTDILRSDWGFDGAVMTDWFGGADVAKQVHAGNDLMMPGRPDQEKAIIDAVKSGALDVKDVDASVRRVLELVVRSPRFKGYKYSNRPDLAAHAKVTRESAAEGMVLLKNDGGALPLAAGVKSVAAFGTTSYDFISGGTGSGDVNEAYTVSLVDGLENAGYTLDAALKARYEEHLRAENEKNKPEAGPMAAFMPKARAAEFVPDRAFLDALAKRADVALVTIGRNSGEFQDRLVAGDFDLAVEEAALVKDVSEAFRRAGKKTVVILNIGGVVETASWKRHPDAILLAWQAGQEGGNSVADVLGGAVSPSGKLPMTFPVRLEDVPSHKNFPLDYAPGAPDLSPQPSQNRPNIDFTDYAEDVFVGYRHYDTHGKEVSYPFGYGLSYAKFDYSEPSLSRDGDGYAVGVTVKNSGAAAGKEVVQLYVGAPPNPARPKPAKELKGFAKTRLLQPGEGERVTIKVAAGDLASFDADAGKWVVDAGGYKFHLASSSRDIRATLTATR